MTLTKRQKEILDFIEEGVRESGYAPTLQEIGDHFGLKSLATVHKHVSNLESKGLIRRKWNHSRAIELVQARKRSKAVELPLLGQVAAGEPIEAVVSHDTISVPQDLIPRRGSCYVLKVRGDSMIDEYIESGDFVVVHSREDADDGEMVVALVSSNCSTLSVFTR